MKVIVQEYEVVCSVCGGKSDHSIIKQSDTKGAPDLDLRPAEPHRSTMNYWVMECPHCGYCNDMLINSADFDHEYFKSTEYLTLGGIKTDNELASQFIKKALVNIKNHNLPEAVQSYLYAAWVFDDNSCTESAKECRMTAVNIIDQNSDAFKNNDNFQILKADMLRRSGEFDRVINEYNGKKFANIILTVMSEFEVRRSKKSDSAVYCSDDVPGIAAK